MFDIIQSATFSRWLMGLKDRDARARILARIDRMGNGNLGDVKPVGQGVSEARIDYGPGYRLYFLQHGKTLIIMLAGGDKKTQAADIKRARQLAEEWRVP